MLLFLAIPTLAVLVAGRQLYLSAYHDLSAWKGGGMGMFASADTLARYVRVFIETPDQKRILINKLTSEQNDLLLNTMYYPSERNLNTLGASLRQTSFSASRQPTQVTRFDQSGKPWVRAARATWWHLPEMTVLLPRNSICRSSSSCGNFLMIPETDS